MAETVDEFPVNRKGKLVQQKYPWDEWLDGRVWVLMPGEDFQCKISSFRSLYFGQAKYRGLAVRSRVCDGKLYIEATKRVVDQCASAVDK